MGVDAENVVALGIELRSFDQLRLEMYRHALPDRPSAHAQDPIAPHAGDDA